MSKPPIVPVDTGEQSLPETLPPTDPAILKAMDDARLSEKHYAAIGRIASQWSYFEAVIDLWLIRLANIDPEIGICFTAQMMGSRPRVDAFIAMVRHLGAAASWIPTLEQFAKDVFGLSEQRNRAVHDVWRMSDPTNPRRRERSARRKVRAIEIEVSTLDLQKLAHNITSLWIRFDDMASAISTELHARRDATTSPGQDL